MIRSILYITLLISSCILNTIIHAENSSAYPHENHQLIATKSALLNKIYTLQNTYSQAAHTIKEAVLETNDVLHLCGKIVELKTKDHLNEAYDAAIDTYTAILYAYYSLRSN